MAYQECTDVNGVKYELRELTPVDTLDIIEAAGDASANSTWIQYAMMICAVESINGDSVPMPQNKQQVRKLAKRVGNAGIVAIQKVMFPARQDPEDAEEVAKN